MESSSKPLSLKILPQSPSDKLKIEEENQEENKKWVLEKIQ